MDFTVRVNLIVFREEKGGSESGTGKTKSLEHYILL